MTPAERLWPRLLPVLRPVAAVPMGELRVHPDLIDRLVALNPPDGRQRLQVLMGAAVLVGSTGVIYALAYSQSFLAIRLPHDVDETLAAAVRQNPAAATASESRARQRADRVAMLGAEWTIVEPWRGVTFDDVYTAFDVARTFADASNAGRQSTQ